MYRTTRWIEQLHWLRISALICTLACAGRAAFADESLFAQHNTTAQDEQPRQASPTTNGIRQATHVEGEPARLAAATSGASLPLPGAPNYDAQKPSSGVHTLEALFSVIVSLAVVLGLFFLIAWLMRRGLPTSSTARLPAEVVDVLGRASLAGRQQMHLLRLGNKLLLVCVSPTGVDTLGEITDPTEVERLAAMCRAGNSAGSGTVAKSLQQVFARATGKSQLSPAALAREAGDA